MNLPIRSLLGLVVLVVILAACGTTAAAPPSAPAVPTAPAEPTEKPSDTPSEKPTEKPSQAPSEAPEAPEARNVVGTITFAEGMAFSGPGGSIAEALAYEGDYPSLVNGVLFKDTDGKIYLADSLTDADAPTFGEPLLEVLDYPANAADWDMETGELIGLREANGILFREGAQVLGFVEAT